MDKFSRPLPPDDLIPRHRLLERLQGGLHLPLTLISAPAGYGKTMLASTWLEGCGCPSAWLSLDQGDSDLVAFLGHFITAIHTIFPGSLPQTLALSRASSQPVSRVVAEMLLNELDRLQQRFVLVLDDYHLVRDPAVDQLLHQILNHAPRSLHLVLSSRCEPSLPLVGLRAHGQITEIRFRDLRLTVDEVAAYLQKAVARPLDENLPVGLQDETEGWLAGVRRAAELLNGGEDRTVGQAFTLLPADHQLAFDDLFEEVTVRLPWTVQDFLVKTSVLSRMCGPLCEAVTGQDPLESSGQAWLEWLEQANLFLVPLDDHNQWFRYQHQFKEHLERRLASDYSATEISALHARACAWYLKNGLLTEALHHAVAGDDKTTAVHLIAAQRHAAMNREQWSMLEQVLGLVPRQAVDAHPELLLLETWILYHHFRLTEIAEHLDRVEVLLEQQSLSYTVQQNFEGEIETLRSLQFFWEADSEKSAQAARHALAVTPIGLSDVRGVARANLAGALVTGGDQRGAFEILNEGLSEGRVVNGAFSPRLLIAFAFIHWTAADPQGLLQTATYLLALANERRLPESIAWAHYLQGCAHYLLNDLESAESCFAAVVSMEHFAHAFAFAQASFGLASTYLARGRFEPAQKQAESLAAYAVKTQDPRLRTAAQIFQSHAELMQGQTATARRWTASCELQAQPAAFPEFHIPCVTLVKTLLALGTPTGQREANSLLAQLRELAEATHNIRLLIEVLALQAVLRDAQGDAARALVLLDDAVTLAQAGGTIRLFVDLGPGIAGLLRRLGRERPESEYVGQLLAAFPAPGPGQGSAIHEELIEPLSPRELAVLTLLRERLSNKEIGQELSISTQTVKRHTMNIYQKLLVQGRHDAVAKALSLGIMSEFARPVRRP